MDDAVVDYPEVAAPELDPSAYAGAHFDNVPLALLPQQIASLVAARGGVDDDPVETVLRGIWDSDERVPKPITEAVGSAIYSVRGRR